MKYYPGMDKVDPRPYPRTDRSTICPIVYRTMLALDMGVRIPYTWSSK
jgi:hypothetical protein